MVGRRGSSGGRERRGGDKLKCEEQRGELQGRAGKTARRSSQRKKRESAAAAGHNPATDDDERDTDNLLFNMVVTLLTFQEDRSWLKA